MAPMRELTFSLFTSKTSRSAKPETRSWAEWCKTFSEFTVIPVADPSDKKQILQAKGLGPGIVLGYIREGQPRENAEVVSINALALDLDHATHGDLVQVEQALEPYEYCYYTTFQHGAPHLHVRERTRLRFILPLPESEDPETVKTKLWPGLNALTGGFGDTAANHHSQLLFLPATWDRSIAFAERHEGAWIDREVLLEWAAKVSPPAARQLRPGDRARMVFESVSGRAMVDGVPLKGAAQALLRGEPYAEPGARHEVMLGLTKYLAIRTHENPLRWEDVEPLFERSLAAMQRIDSTCEGMDAVETAFLGAQAKASAWAAFAEEEKKARARSLQLGGRPPYTAEELEAIAGRQGFSVEDLEHCWILQNDRFFYFLLEDGTYSTPVAIDEAGNAAWLSLARAPVMLVEPTAKGTRLVPIKELAMKHGRSMNSPVKIEIYYDMTSSWSHLDLQKRIFYEAVCKRREDMQPKFDAEIDRFLQIFAGAQYPDLCLWLANLTDLTQELPALFFLGSAASGKTLLTESLAKIWTTANATPLHTVVSSFNEGLLECPLVSVDESMPVVRDMDVTSKVRSMITAESTRISRKHRKEVSVKGYFRFIFTSNNNSVLHTMATLGSADIDALSRRSALFEIGDQPVAYLKQRPAHQLDYWRQRGIAEHVLWLVENCEEKYTHDLNSANSDRLRGVLLANSDMNFMVNQWLVYYLSNPIPFDNSTSNMYIRIDKSKGPDDLSRRFLVNVQALLDGWMLYFPQTKIEPHARKISMALSSISKRDTVQLRYRGRRITYRDVDIRNLFAWSTMSHIGEQEQIERTLGLRAVTEGDVTDTDSLESLRTSRSEAKPKKNLESKILMFTKEKKNAGKSESD